MYYRWSLAHHRSSRARPASGTPQGAYGHSSPGWFVGYADWGVSEHRGRYVGAELGASPYLVRCTRVSSSSRAVAGLLFEIVSGVFMVLFERRLKDHEIGCGQCLAASVSLPRVTG
jgi:hypothetical protein